ncbi:MAG TPA: hypothetical protein PLU30_17885 [Verrucomicrobiae bacterium]|nr:hypothetical protein [Verrucomicrobiae bacterium]
MIVSLFERGDGPGAAALRWWQRCPFAHVKTAFLLPNGRWKILEALGEINRVVWRDPMPADAHARALTFIEPPTSKSEALAAGFAAAQDGKGYDYAGIGAFLARRDRTAAELQREREGREVWFCSEIDFAIAAKAGRPLHARMQPFECSVRDAWISPVRIEIPNPLPRP